MKVSFQILEFTCKVFLIDMSLTFFSTHVFHSKSKEEKHNNKRRSDQVFPRARQVTQHRHTRAFIPA